MLTKATFFGSKRVVHTEIYRCDRLRGKHLVSYIHIACISEDLYNISNTQKNPIKRKSQRTADLAEIDEGYGNSPSSPNAMLAYVSCCYDLYINPLGFDNPHTGFFFFFSN